MRHHHFAGIALLISVLVYGQTPTATLSGVVRDPSGAVASGVQVRVVNTATRNVRSATTDSDGRYNLTNLEPGPYEMRAELSGFKTTMRRGVVLTVGGSEVVDITLEIGASTEVVNVTDQPPLIDSTKAEVSRVVTSQSIESLPIAGRNFVDFAKLSSGVAPGRENVGGGAFKEPDAGVGESAAPRLSFGGQSELNSMILVDGADNIQTFTGLPRATPSQESVQEFRVLNSTYAAEYGGALGGFVNIVTKSGTNDIHGSGYYFGMNNALDATPLLTGPNPALRQNQFGGTLGAPLVKDRTFIFANYEGQRRAESNKFSTVILNNLGGINATKRSFGLTPEITNQLRTNDYDGFLGKIDHHFNVAHSASFRYNVLSSETNGFLGGGGRASPASSTARNNNTLDQSLVASELAVFGPNKVNEFRFQWAKRTFDFQSVLKEPDFEISNLIITGKSTSDVDFYRENRAEVSDSFNLTVGSHSIKFGGEFSHLQNDSQWDLFFPARVIFANLNGFLAGTPVVFWWPLLSNGSPRPGLGVPFTQDVPTAWQPFTRTSLDHNAYGLFLQDEWKATSALTLTYGARYDFETYPDKFFLNRDWNNIQPRVGFAYAYGHHGVVRGGFGIFDDRLVSSIGQVFNTAEWISVGDQANAAALYPNIAPIHGRFFQPTLRGPAAVAATRNFTATGQTPAPPMLPSGQIPPGFTDNLAKTLRTPYSEQASLKVSQEIGGGMAVSVSYLYVHGVDTGSHTGLINGIQTGTLASGKPIFGQRLFPELGDFYVKDSGGNSNYHGGSFELEKQFSHGLSFHSSYTFAKTIGNTDSVANLADLPEGPNRSLERALSRQDVRHRYTLAFVSEVPGTVALLHDFRLSSLLSVQSGRPFNIFAGSDANLDGNPLSDRPGNVGRNTFQGPSFASLDTRIGRTIRFTERFRAELNFDLFNLLNRDNITDLNTVYGGLDLTVPPNPILGYGTPRDAANKFQFQYSMKLHF